MKKILFLGLLVTLYNHNISAQKLKTKNIILITIDGFRWQELFNGADSSLMDQQHQLIDPIGIKNHFWRDNKTHRKNALLPFFWSTIERQGQIYGNREYNNYVNVTNRQWFSYPGYNELLTGQPDDLRINSNDKKFNPNITVLEFINNMDPFYGKVAVFSSWDCFPYIINAERSGIPVSAGLTSGTSGKSSPTELMLDKMINSLPNPLSNVRLDAFTFYYGLEYLRENKPRLMFFSFDETDDFAHKGEYGAYLNSAHYTDGFIRELWDYLQSVEFYKGITTLIITTDHGRGNNGQTWKDHGINIEGSDQIWIAFLGPDTPPSGEITVPGQFYQNQVASTLAAFLNIEFNETGKSGATIKEAFR